MKNALVILFAVCATICNAQRIKGYFDINPNISYADIQVNILIDGEVVGEVQATTDIPFQFDTPMREEWKGKKISFDLVINKPSEDYIVDKRKCNLNWTGSDKRIFLRRKADIYASQLSKAISLKDAGQFGVAKQSFKFILDNKELLGLNGNQIFEATLGLSSISIDENNFSEQQLYLDSLGNWVDLSELSKVKFDRFSKEKFNGLLKLCRYNTLNYPSLDFGKLVTEDDDKFTLWAGFIDQAGSVYLPPDLQGVQKNPEIIRRQVESLALILN